MKITHAEIKRLMQIWMDTMADKKDELIKLDMVVGDGDLGLTMSDGFKAASDAIKDSEEIDIGKLSYFAGKAMGAKVPSTMGTLMASGLMNAGKALRGREELSTFEMSEFFQAYFDGVKKLGKAEVGEKTFLDGIAGSIEYLQQGADKNISDSECAEKLIEIAHKDYLSTEGMLALHGRAAARGEKSRGFLDPGAAVGELLIKGYAKLLQTA